MKESSGKKDLISIRDLKKEEVEEIFSKTSMLKGLSSEEANGEKLRGVLLSGKTLALIFEKPSMRTRISFEVAMRKLGGHSICLGQNEIQLGVRESIGDIGKVLSGYVDGIVLRTFAHSNVIELAESASVPVINGLSDRLHPCQVLSDIYTIHEKKGSGKVKVAFIGDGNNNVAHSWLYGAAKTGLDLSIATPHGYEPLQEIVEEAIDDARESGAKIEVMNDAADAVKGADIVYTDVWASMGKEEEREQRKKVFEGYQLTQELLEKTGKNSLVMHCLPAHRGEEITDAVIDGPNSIVFDQAENRLHVQKGVLLYLLK